HRRLRAGGPACSALREPARPHRAEGHPAGGRGRGADHGEAAGAGARGRGGSCRPPRCAADADPGTARCAGHRSGRDSFLMAVTVQRLDLVLVERGIATTRERAQAMVAAGMVEVDGQQARSAAQRVGEAAELRMVGEGSPWASRAGEKLVAALDAFSVDCQGRVCLDAGASTGGFTDVLLSRGAARVYAVDVGHGQLLTRVADDPRVSILDRTNLRYLEQLPGGAPTMVTLDLSFISLGGGQ